jgi:ADP-heptose:LPS heptosyltransferase
MRQALRATKKWYFDRFNLAADRVCFPVWLAYQCLRQKKRAVILHRINALGDVLCTLPMGDEIRKRHPGRLFVFVTVRAYEKMVLLSRVPDRVYGSRSWSFSPPTLCGLVEKVYSPKTTDERDPQAGATVHLVDDLARSCGFTPAQRQPRLFPSATLIQKTLDACGLTADLATNRRLFAINCGHTWPVRMWDAAKWQTLVDRLHAEYNAVIIQFGLNQKDGATDEYNRLRGVRSFIARLKSDELVALVARCHLLISIDSGPVHIAGAVGTPVVGLFGAVNPALRLPPDSPAAAVFSQVPCRFCHHTTPPGHWKTGCPHAIRCMKELDVETVFQAVKTMLDKQASYPLQP